MTALPDVPKVIRTTLVGVITPNHTWVTRFYVKYTGTPPDNTQLSTWAFGVSSSFGTHLKGLMSTADQLNSVEATDLSSPTAAVGLAESVVVGTRAGTDLPASIALVLSYGVHRRYRGGHPRGYWRMGVEADTPNAVGWDSTFLASIVPAFQAFKGDIFFNTWSAAGTLSQVNVSYFKGFTVVISPTTGRAENVPTLRPTPVVDDVVTVVARSSLGSQRRRLAFQD